MGNCFEACGADFEGTIEMVAGARRLTKDEVIRMLERVRATDGATAEYRDLRARLPAPFPF